MNGLKSIIYLLSIMWISVALSGCVDEGPGSYVSSDGEALVSLEAVFSPFSTADLTRASKVDPFNSISDIAVIVFDAQGNLLPDYLKEVVNPQTVDEDREDKDAAYGSSAELKTKKVDNIPLLLPKGTYYVIGVANFGSYESDESGVIKIKMDASGSPMTSLARIRREIEKHDVFTLDTLRALKVDWIASDYADNRAMLGYFTSTDSKESTKPHAASKFETLTVDHSGIIPRAWLRRCASKITVDFDGSGLRDNVSIFIKDVRIFDLAKDCTLGFGNPTSDEENLKDFNNKVYSDKFPNGYDGTDYPEDYPLIYNDGQYIEFGEGDNPDSWPRISKHTPYITDADGNKKDLHTQDSECLYFYENMQGTRQDYDRSPKPNLSEGGLAEGYNEKDGKPYGTYIEVSARHVVEEDGESHYKDMKYRFMIGKNVTNNFDAERNHHYKLTLAFNGTSDEYHWHIDYDRNEEGFKVPNPWYVSYVYNHDAYLPFEFNLSDEWEVQDMVAEIVTNPWYPTSSGNNAEGLDADFTDPDFEISPDTPYGDSEYPYLQGDNKYTGNGFLSLRAPCDETVLTDTRVGITWSGYNLNAKKINQDYFDGKSAGKDNKGNPVTPVDHGKRFIIKDAVASTDNRNAREALSVKRENGNYSIEIPLFTREKSLIKQTGYCGNNPFVGYQRVAKVKLTATARKLNNPSEKKVYEAKVNVVQVRRVVNPKGIYRKKGNNEPFHVNLKYLTSERADGTFEPIVSRGPWMAEVLGDNNFITLDGKQRVSGASRSEIDFTIKFNRMGGSGNKNAIVRIKYHNYTCTHLIFVRQGYDPQAICGGGPIFNNTKASATIWNTFNMIAGNKMADDPRDEGSMFKFGNPDNGISSIDNIYKDESGNPIFYEQSRDGFTPHETLTILSSDGSVYTGRNRWKELVEGNEDFSVAKNDDGTPMKISSTATMRDFEQLYLTNYIEFGYGVLYADGATETQSTLEMVNGWYRDDPDSIRKNQKGMRGVFAYFWDPNMNSEYNTRNIFFPIGRSGYGHRKNKSEDKNANRNGMGILRYSCNRAVPAKDYGSPYNNFQHVAPLFEFLYRRMGAIYWARSVVPAYQYLSWNGQPDNSSAIGLDLNYFSFDVNAIASITLDYGRDACFVRTVERSAGE